MGKIEEVILEAFLFSDFKNVLLQSVKISFKKFIGLEFIED